MEKPPYLTLVDPRAHDPQADEFLPLPFYPWDERPAHLPLDHDECATAIHLAGGSLKAAADLLKVPLFRLSRSLRASPRLQKVREESLSIGVAKAESKVFEALDAGETVYDSDGNAEFVPNHRRQEWAVNKILASRAAMGTPLSPAPAASIQSNSSLTLNSEKRSVTFRWRTDTDAALPAAENDIDQ